LFQPQGIHSIPEASPRPVLQKIRIF
jgi:hypothetical protein